MEVAMQLGKKIRELRCRRGLTVQQLAAASGLSKGFISQVENDRTSPSLATLRDLARALDTTVSYLVVEDEQTPYIVRGRERPVRSSPDRSRVEIMSAQPRRNLELLSIEIPPGASAGSEQHFHHGEECVVCLEGRVRVTCGDHSLFLDAGDSCHYEGRVPHSIENAGSANARVLIATTPSVFEPAQRARQTAANGNPMELETLS
jgi:transcriptional regulator with XRE-family HTH domain